MAADEKFSNAMRAARSRLITLGGVFVGIVAVALIWMWMESGHESTDDAQVDAHITQIAAQVAGTVTTVAVHDNQRVKAGDVLIRLDPRDYQAAVERAKAELADAEAARSPPGRASRSPRRRRRAACRRPRPAWRSRAPP